MVKANLAAVVTGDVNASSRMHAAEARQLESILAICFEETADALPGADLGGYTGFRGDAWQFAVGRPDQAVRAALFFRSRLLVASDREFGRRLHSAVAVGFGGIDYLPGAGSSAGGGEAYRVSGHRLDRLRRRIPGMGVAGLEDLEANFDVLLGVIDALARSWTAHRAEAVSLAIRGLSQGEIANRWQPKVSQQAIHKHLSTAGWPAIEPALEWMETTLYGCIGENNHEGL